MGSRWGAVVSVVVALLIGLLSPAPAGAGFSILYPKGPDPAVAEWPQWPYPVSCGGLQFDPVVAFGGPTNAEKGAGGPERALAAYLDAAAGQAAISKSYWRLVAADETTVEFAEGRLEQGAAWLRFQLSGGAWRPVGSFGFCVPRTIREGSESARWEIDDSQALGPNTRRIKVNLSAGGGCDGGRSLNAAAERPEFHQFGRKLAMTIWLEPLPPGNYTCQASIEPPLVVKLPGRLGDRRLFDGRTYSPRLRQ